MWWELAGDEMGRQLVGYVRELEQSQRGAQVTNLRNLRMYAALESAGQMIFRQNLVTSGVGSLFARPRVTLNVVKSCIDTLTAKVSKQNINPQFLTSNQSYESQARSKKLTSWNRGLFQTENVYSVNALVCRDASTFSGGFVKVYGERNAETKKGRVRFERVFPDEILVDANDAYYDDPQMLYQVKSVSKSVLKGRFPGKAALIDTCASIRSGYATSQVECVLVVEAWRLPDPNGKGGKHVLAIENGVLAKPDEYEKDHFPFARLNFTRPMLGFHGYSVADELVGIQFEINRLLLSIQQAMQLLSNPRVYIDMASKVNEQQMTNEIGGIVYFAGSPPVIQAAATVHPELFQHLDRLYSRAFEIVGISAMSAQSKNVLGANASGAAMRQFADIETERFAVFAKAYQQMHVDEAKLAVECAQELERDGFRVEVVSRDRKVGAERLDWKDMDYDADDFIIECYPVSALPQEPSARLQQVMEWQQMGWVDPEEAQDLADLPDLDSDRRLATAPRRWVRQKIERMIEKNEYQPPEPYEPVDIAKKVALQYLADAELRDSPEETKALLREYIDDLAAMSAPPPAPVMNPAAQAQAAQLAAPVQNMVDPSAIGPMVA
jgi:hypothetical protein